jgi:hypothetical protein
MARPLYAQYPLAIELDAKVYPWAPFRPHKAAIKRHTMLHLCGFISTFIHITARRMDKVNILDQLNNESGADYLFDRSQQLYVIHQGNVFFVTLAESHTKFKRR